MQQGDFIGQIIARRYVVQRYLDRGQFGSVYYGINQNTQIPVAIKIDNQHRTLCHEATVLDFLYRSGCRAVPRVCWFGLPQPNNPIPTCLVMEYFPQSLHEHFPETAFDKTRMMRQMITILREIHSLGIIHRDIKPKNFMWSTPTRQFIRLIDFGLATVYDSPDTNRPIRQDTTPTGNWQFMSPFVKQGEVPTRRDDLISVGYIYTFVSTPQNTQDTDEPNIKAYMETCCQTPGNKKPDYEKLKRVFSVS